MSLGGILQIISLSACESLEKRVEYTAADLQVLTEEANKRITGMERLVQSTPMPRQILRVFLTEKNRQAT